MNQIPDDLSSVSPQILRIRGVVESDGLRIAVWEENSREMINQAKMGLEDAITPVISPSCTHMKGRGGAKGCIRDVQKQVSQYPFVARFDGASLFDSIDNAILLSQLEEIATPLPYIAVVSQYLTSGIPESEFRLVDRYPLSPVRCTKSPSMTHLLAGMESFIEVYG